MTDDEPEYQGPGWRNFALAGVCLYLILLITDAFFLGWFVVDCPILYWIAGAC